MSADYNKPVTTDAYTAVLQSLRDNINAVACMLDPTTAPVSGAANVPTGAHRFNASTGLFEWYNGTTWATLATNYITTAGGTLASGAVLALTTTGGNNAIGIAGGNGDACSATANNLKLYSWFGIGFGPSISGQAVAYGTYSHWFDTRTGNMGIAGQLSASGLVRGTNVVSTWSASAVETHLEMGNSGLNRGYLFASADGATIGLAACNDSGGWYDTPMSIGRAGGQAISFSRYLQAGQGAIFSPGPASISTTGSGGQAARFLNAGGSNYGRVVEFQTTGGTDGPFAVFARGSSTPANWQLGIAQQSDSTDFYLGVVDNAFGGRQFRFSTGGAFTASFIRATGLDGIRTVYGSYGAFIRNDGSDVFLLQTASGDQYGSYNTFRPFKWNLTSGAVVIDGTGAGASFGGNVTAAGTVSAPLITQSSDATLKYGIAPLKTSAEIIKGLARSTASFRWLYDDRDDCGFIAQLAADAEPLAVHRRGDGKLTINVVPIVAHLANHAADLERRLQHLERRAA